MRFCLYFFMFFFLYADSFGMAPQEVMSHEVTIDLFYLYIERQYVEGRIAPPYCVLACVVTERMTRQIVSPEQPSERVPSIDSVAKRNALNMSPVSNNVGLKDSVHAFLSEPPPEKKSKLQLNNGVLSAVFGNFSIGVNLVELASFILTNIQGYIAKKRVEKQFVQRYQEWGQEDFKNEAQKIIKRCQRVDDSTMSLSYSDQEAILSEYHLYQFDGFRSYIKTLSEYEPFIKQLYNRVHCDDKHRNDRWWKKFPGYLDEAFPAVIESLCTQVKHKEAERTKYEQLQIARRNKAEQEMRAQVQQHLHFYAEYMRDCADEYALAVGLGRCDTHAQADRFAMRDAAIIQSESNNYQFDIKTYNISSQQDAFLQDRGLNIDLFRECEGSTIQQCLHQEMITILDQAVVIRYEYEHVHNPSLTFFTNAIGDLASVSAEYNHAGHVKQALLLTDCCWSFLECTIGIAQGMCDGIYNTVYAFDHPIETIGKLTQCISNAAWYLGKVLYELCSVNIMCIIDRDAGHERLAQMTTNIQAVVSDLAHKIEAMPSKTIARGAAAHIVEAILIKKCLAFLYAAYVAAHKKLTAAIQIAQKSGTMPSVAGSPEIVLVEEAIHNAILMEKEKAVGLAIHTQ
ncbi:MAG TPA: hypothetical protein VGT41_05435 [Candidatus Babeliales bacterium]|nr:hypothetical protein [Candidatus Babeliales bacterium]